MCRRVGLFSFACEALYFETPPIRRLYVFQKHYIDKWHGVKLCQIIKGKKRMNDERDRGREPDEKKGAIDVNRDGHTKHLSLSTGASSR